MKSKRGGRRDNPGGRPPKPIEERAAWKGKVAIRISVEAAAQLQQRMLGIIPGIGTPEQMVEALITSGILLTPDIRAALPFLQDARQMCWNEQAQRGLDSLIATLAAPTRGGTGGHMTTVESLGAYLLDIHQEKTAQGLVPAIENWWTAGHYGKKRSKLVWVNPAIANSTVWGAPDGTHWQRIGDFPDWLARIARPELPVEVG
jgi:hypothetical protein